MGTPVDVPVPRKMKVRDVMQQFYTRTWGRLPGLPHIREFCWRAAKRIAIIPKSFAHMPPFQGSLRHVVCTYGFVRVWLAVVQPHDALLGELLHVDRRGHWVFGAR